MHPRIPRSALTLALALSLGALAGCPEAPENNDPPPGDDDNNDDPDAGTTPDAGPKPEPDAGPGPEPDAGPGPDVGGVHTTGRYLAAPVGDVLASDQTSLILAGTVGTLVDPIWFDLDTSSTADEPVMSAGLIAHDTASATTRVLTSEDGLPTDAYFDVPELEATVPFFDLEWIEEGASFAAASWSHVVRGTIDASGALSFTSVTLRAPDLAVDAAITAVVMSGGELFVGTDQGVFVLDPASLEVQRMLALPAPLAWVWGFAAGDLSGDAVVALASPVDAFGASHVVLARPGSADVTALPALEGTVPTSVVGLQGSFLVGALVTNQGGAVYSLGETPEGPALLEWIGPAELVDDAGAPVVPGKLAVDLAGGRVLVGGQILAGSLIGGGLVGIDADASGARLGDPRDVVERRDPYRAFIPGFVDTLTVDASGDIYVAGRELCSETRLGRVPLVRIERHVDEESLRVQQRAARPWVSGVRDIADDPASETTWLGLRDEIPGLRCEGIVVAQNVCQLRADGSCEIFTPFVNDELRRYPASVGASAIAFGDPTREEMAIATSRDETYLRVGGASRSVATQIDPSLNLFTTSAAWSESGLWIGSEMHWEEFTDPELDDDAINARGPHGLGYLELNADGSTRTSRRYVSFKPVDSLVPDEVEGLPSNWVSDVVALPGARRALVACGIERLSRSYDHLQPEVSPPHREGGVAVIDDETVTKVQGPSGMPVVDVVDLAVGPDGTHYALDAQSGVMQLDLGAMTSSAALRITLPEGERATAVAVLDGAGFAIGTNRGLRLYSATGGLTVVDVDGGTGAVWDIERVGEGLLAVGTDQGLLHVAVGDAALPGVLGPVGPLARDWLPISWGCFGEDGCPCDPGIGAECAPDATCEFDVSGGICQLDGACEGLGCPCDENVRCDPGFVCGVDNTCEEAPPPDTCTLDCSCDTLSGCPDGMVCQGGFAGFSCL